MRPEIQFLLIFLSCIFLFGASFWVNDRSMGVYVVDSRLYDNREGVFGCGGILLLFYTMVKRPMPNWNAGVLLCGVSACLSVALGLTWATVYRENGRTRK